MGINIESGIWKQVRTFYEEWEMLDFEKWIGYNKLAVAFKWRIYENRTLGAGEGRKYTKLIWYTVLLIQWMQGHGLSYIICRSIDDYDEKKREVKVDYNKWETFDGSQKHKNIIIADTLEAIKEVLLFRLSNYFLKFTEEYKRQHPDEPFTNNWTILNC